jgi:GntR family transcriptional regulator, transcriptional repressor for pyruvate dehydrogenase complex
MGRWQLRSTKCIKRARVLCPPLAESVFKFLANQSIMNTPTESVFAGTASSRGLRVPKAGEMVANQLRRTIIEGGLKEGDSLPLEKDLLAHFGVSRPTLREAFRMLEAEGLISISRGSRTGARVHRPNIHVAARYMGFVLEASRISLDDVYSARVMIEPAAVRHMAEHSGRKAAVALRAALEELEVHLDDDQQYGVFLARFHRKLVELADVRTLTLLMDLVQSVLETYFSSVTRRAAAADADVKASKRKGFRARQKLIELVEAGKAAEAEAYWRKHLQISQQVMLRWIAGSAQMDLSQGG